MNFYTYLHCKPDGTPFYVGKGKGIRAYRLHRIENIHHQRIVAKYGKHDIRVFVFPCDSEEQAFADEIQQIAQLRSEGFELCNQTTGGDGASGFIQSAETISKRAKKLIGNKYALGHSHPQTEQFKAEISIRMKGNKHGLGHKASDEKKAKISIANTGNKYSLGKKNAKGYKHSEAAKLRISLAVKARWEARNVC